MRIYHTPTEYGRYLYCYLKSTGHGSYNMNFPVHISAMRCSFTPNVEPPRVADGQYTPKRKSIFNIFSKTRGINSM